jgi:homoserine O-acetyltransferase
MTALIGGGSTAQELSLGPFTGADGRTHSGLRLRYRVLGDVGAAREHGWILVFHALTGSADAEAWWGPMIGPGRALDTTRHAIVAANLLGSCYGSTGPQEWATEHDEPFPEFTPADLALAHVPLLGHLGVDRLTLATGGSLGGMVALEWGRRSSVPVDRLVVFAAPARTSAQSIAWNAVQRMAIEADPAWRRGRYLPGQGPVAGLAAARALAMITYRSGVEFESRFGRASSRAPDRFDVDHYLRRQGDKLVARFDAASYVALMRAMDLHDVGDVSDAARQTAERVGRVIGVGVDTDILYLPGEVRAWTDAYRAGGVDARYREIRSPSGHDAFLIEWDQVERILGEVP